MEAEVRKLNSALTTQEAETKLKQIETENTEMMVSKFWHANFKSEWQNSLIIILKYFLLEHMHDKIW